MLFVAHFSVVMLFLLGRHRACSQRRGRSGIDVLLGHMQAIAQTAFLVAFGGKTPNRLSPFAPRKPSSSQNKASQRMSYSIIREFLSAVAISNPVFLDTTSTTRSTVPRSRPLSATHRKVSRACLCG